MSEHDAYAAPASDGPSVRAPDVGAVRLLAGTRIRVALAGAFLLLNAMCSGLAAPLSVGLYFLISGYQAELGGAEADPKRWIGLLTLALPGIYLAMTGLLVGISAARQGAAFASVIRAPTMAAFNDALRIHRNGWRLVGMSILASPLVLAAMWALSTYGGYEP